jgi:hypothetical protein
LDTISGWLPCLFWYTHSTKMCTCTYSTVDMYLPYSRLYSMFVFLDPTWRRGREI